MVTERVRRRSRCFTGAKCTVACFWSASITSLRRPEREPRLHEHAGGRVGFQSTMASDFLAGAIESVLAQTHRNFELLVVDNASDDATAEISSSYASSDGRVRS